jgi:hypothetical protein
VQRTLIGAADHDVRDPQQLAKAEMIRTATLCLCVSLLAIAHGPWALADTYSIDPAPAYSQGTAHISEDYGAPHDPAACDLYLRSLQYSARRNLPMSCDRPVAPLLLDKISRVTWEDLDPDKYPELFRALVAKKRLSWPNPATAAEVDWQRGFLMQKEFVFQRAKLPLVGRPNFEGENKSTEVRTFWLVRYGPNTVSVGKRLFHCTPTRGGFQEVDFPLVYLATEDLGRLYGNLVSFADGEGPRSLLIINGRPYVEEILYDGDIRLSDLLLEFPVILKPACLYHYKRSRK